VVYIYFTFNICTDSLPFCHLDDDEFSVAIYELANGTVNFNSDRLLSLKFNPLIPGKRNLALSSDLDPDSNFNFDMFRCDYFTESQFNELFHKTRSSFSNCFSLLHLNVRSLSRNYDNFTSFLANIEGTFSIMGVSETWLKDSGHSFDIMGYDFIHNPRPNRIGGGVGIYVNNDLELNLVQIWLSPTYHHLPLSPYSLKSAGPYQKI